MDSLRFCRLLIAGLYISAFGCTGPAGTATPSRGITSAPQVQVKKQITNLIKAEPTLLVELSASGGGVVAGTSELLQTLQDGLSILNHQGNRVAQAAATLPTVENGLWKVFPDGRMETTWNLTPNVRWHDGTPFTSADLLFTLDAKRDKDLPFATNPTRWIAWR